MSEKPNYLKPIKNFITNRLLFILVLAAGGFLFLTSVLFDHQIVQGEYYSQSLQQSFEREIRLPAVRGNIYDRFGRPLAINMSAHSVRMDPSIAISPRDLNVVLLNLVRLLEHNEEDFVDTLPISLEEPFEFTFFGDNAERQRINWLNEMNMSENITTGQQAMDHLLRIYFINEMDDITPLEARKIADIRAHLFTRRYSLFSPITVAVDISLATITVIEEDPDRFLSVFIDTEQLRHYPGHRYFSHIIGHIGNVQEGDDIASLLERGIARTDLIGRAGIEAVFEDNLRGRAGSEYIMVNNRGRRVGVVEDSRIAPTPGGSVYLTLDKYFQIEAFHHLERTLAQMVINRLTTSISHEPELTVSDLLASFVQSNNINFRNVFDNTEETDSLAQTAIETIREYVLENEGQWATRDGRLEVNTIIANAITENDITPVQILLVMYELGIITSEYEDFDRQLVNRQISPLSVVTGALRSGEITPHQANVDPSTGSLMVVDVHTGEVLAAVSYPTFDNNQLVNNFNNEYWVALLDDPTSPLFNRAFSEQMPPGSVFKMATGIAALESGTITPHTTIVDQPRFTRAGQPYARSHSSFSLGRLNYAEALGVSSNYFFYESAWLMGGGENNRSSEQAIYTLNRYMRALGLDSPSGVEIGEAFRTGGAPSNISSPELQEFRYAQRGLEPRPWTDGDLVRTAIGQSFNAYTSAHMVRYTAAIATKGDMVNLRLLSRTVSEDGVMIAPTVHFDSGIEISESTWQHTHEGMRLTTEGPRGTARGIFANFPMSVGGKTGTAEHDQANRISHTTFNAFAPFEDPQIAIYVAIPFGATRTLSSAAAHVARDVIDAYFRLNNSTYNGTPSNSLVP